MEARDAPPPTSASLPPPPPPPLPWACVVGGLGPLALQLAGELARATRCQEGGEGQPPSTAPPPAPSIVISAHSDKLSLSIATQLVAANGQQVVPGQVVSMVDLKNLATQPPLQQQEQQEQQAVLDLLVLADVCASSMPVPGLLSLIQVCACVCMCVSVCVTVCV